MTANDPFALVTITPTRAPDNLPDAPSDKESLAVCLHQMEAAADEIFDLSRDALTAAIVLGHAAGAAKEILTPSKGWMAWQAKHFGPSSKRPLSVQWLRRCMQASEVSERLEKSPAKLAAAKAKFPTVEKFAAILNDLIAGVDVLAKDYPAAALPPASKVPKLTIDRSPSAKDDPEDDTSDDTTPVPAAAAIALDRRAADLDKRAKALDAKEKRLQEWEDDLTRRAALIGTAGAATDVEAKDPIADLKAAKLANDARVLAKAQRSAGALVAKKGDSKPTDARQSPAKAKVDTKVARTKKTPQIAPETVAAIQAAAAVVDHSASNAGIEKALNLDAATASAVASLSAGHPVNVNEVL